MSSNKFYDFNPELPSNLDQLIQETGRNLGMTWQITPIRGTPNENPDTPNKRGSLIEGVSSNPGLKNHNILINTDRVATAEDTVLDANSIYYLALGMLGETDLALGMYPMFYYRENELRNDSDKEAITIDYLHYFQHTTSIWALDAINSAYPEYLPTIIKGREDDLFVALKAAERKSQLAESGRTIMAAAISHRCAQIAAIHRYSSTAQAWALMDRGRELDNLIEKYRRQAKLPRINAHNLIEIYLNLPNLPKNKDKAVRIMEENTIVTANSFLIDRVSMGSRPYVIKFRDEDDNTFYAWNLIETSFSWN